MAKRLLAYLAFWLLMAMIASASLAVIVLAYLPFVVLKAVWQVAKGRAKIRTIAPAGQ